MNENKYINGVSLKITKDGEIFYYDAERNVNIRMNFNLVESEINYILLKKKIREYDFSYYENFPYYDFNMDLKDEQKQILKDDILELINARKMIKKYLKKHVELKGTYHYNDIYQVNMDLKNLINKLY